MESKIEVSQKTKSRATTQCNDTIPGHISERSTPGYYRTTFTPMFIAALIIIVRLQKQSRCPTTDEWIKKIWYIYTMEFYSAIKKNEIMLFAGRWMEP
jgi:hypothetical protein